MTETTDADGIPIFGAGADHTTTIPFGIEIYDTTTGETAAEYFKARQDIGAGPFVSFTRASSQGGEALVLGSLNLLVRITVDDDGLPSTYTTQPDEEPDPRLADRTQWSSKRRFITYADSDRYHIAFAAMTELAKWIVKQAVSSRPTQGATTSNAGDSSKASSPGPTRTPRGSTGSRSKKAAS